MLSCKWVSSLCNFVAWSANLDHVLSDLHAHGHSQHSSILGLFLLSGRASCEVGLMLSSLCVREVGAIVLMNCETKAAFEGANMVLEEVGVFVEVDGFEGKFAKTFSSVRVGCALRGDTAATKFGPGAVLVVHSEVLRKCGVDRSIGQGKHRPRDDESS